MTRWVTKDAVASISGDEAMPITQSGVDKKVTPDQLREFIAPETLTIVTESSAFTAAPATHAGRSKYIRAGGDVTFDSAETYAAGEVYQIRATAAIDLVEDGVTLTPPAGGTLALDAAMSVQIVMTSPTAGDVIGQTVAA